MYRNFINRILLEEAGADGAAGGSGDKQYVTPEALTSALGTFQTQLLSQVGELFKTQLAGITKKEEPPPVEKKDPPAVDLTSDAVPPALKQILQNLQNQVTKGQETIESERKARQDAEAKAEESNKRSAVATALSKYEYVTEHAAGVALEQIFPRVVKGQDGKYNIDGLPLTVAIKAEMDGPLEYLLRGKNTGGSGANGGTGAGAKVPTLDDIKSGMTPAEKARIANHILSLMPKQNIIV